MQLLQVNGWRASRDTRATTAASTKRIAIGETCAITITAVAVQSVIRGETWAGVGGAE